ncbi:hypothetical protein LTR53_012816 [Teratosphaeriaceae sp. CCFEE 6253]|nr:hypothetical protein LTR53_012816 [Teratosphaeriaceae sp. CCFEE 6253]
MACAVATSPFSEQPQGQEWLKSTESGGGFEALVEFNAGLHGHIRSTVNPQMLSNPPSPIGSYTDDFTGNVQDLPAMDDVGFYSHDFASPQAPYFSVEQPHADCPPTFAASAGLRHGFRRSVSEPPGGPPLHHQLPMSFNRNGHFIGHVQAPELQRLKSLPKSKQNRSQPYKTKAQQQQAPRYHLRRTQTQPVWQHQSPTSMPMGMAPPASHTYLAGPQHSIPSAVAIGQREFEPLPAVPEQRDYISSRVCTPTPDDLRFAASPQDVIDPMFAATVNARGNAVTLPMTVEELRAMITEAVQKAVKGWAEATGSGGKKPVLLAETAVRSAESEQAASALNDSRCASVEKPGSTASNDRYGPSTSPDGDGDDELDSLFVE